MNFCSYNIKNRPTAKTPHHPSAQSSRQYLHLVACYEQFNSLQIATYAMTIAIQVSVYLFQQLSVTVKQGTKNFNALSIK